VVETLSRSAFLPPPPVPNPPPRVGEGRSRWTPSPSGWVRPPHRGARRYHGSWRGMTGGVDPTVLATKAPCLPSVLAAEVPCSPSTLAAVVMHSPFMLGRPHGVLTIVLGHRTSPPPPCLPSQKGEVEVMHCERRVEEWGLGTRTWERIN
jgi:hypothetical protein